MYLIYLCADFTWDFYEALEEDIECYGPLMCNECVWLMPRTHWEG